MTQEKKQEFTLKITQANKTQMITILYEMIIDYLNDAMDEISVGQKSDGEKSLLKAQNCLDELIRSVNLHTDLGKMLHKIYIFSKKELIVSGANHSLHRIWRVKKNIKALHEAYRELEKNDNSEPMMNNTQKVYAGLTYGKHSLNEDVTALSMNRGYVV
ncbi:flagellar protein FliS [Butyrivibrio sp.]|jgi:flagellar protein FliS|uniref:flagellar protein FliS n=1 Tax=Butyrivibrio sp. TaxID=28121 RepID=UPI0025C31C97|nr:flagellar protein FliS [Butyrivibrio sp.]MBQ9301763.1 flagellar protein FliS [Butyrivibrio sp.]